METTIVVLTKDSSLGKELSWSFPRDFKVKTAPPEARARASSSTPTRWVSVRYWSSSERHVVITVTRMADTDPVIEATAAGAYEVLTWPLDRDKVSPMLQELAGCIDEMKSLLPLTVSSHAVTSAIVGRSPLILETCKRLARLSQVDTPVLLTGETGVGKEPIAEALAQLSSRFGKPFVVISCAAVPETLLESELFGFEKGAFTGAQYTKNASGPRRDRSKRPRDPRSGDVASGLVLSMHIQQLSHFRVDRTIHIDEYYGEPGGISWTAVRNWERDTRVATSCVSQAPAP